MLVIFLALHNLVKLGQVLVNVFNPLALLHHDVLSSACVSDLPLVDELPDVAYLRCHRRYAQLPQSPVVLVPSDRDPHCFLRGPSQSALRKLSIFNDLSEN